jgi:DNA-binding NarL/FixJ family response regulator
VEWQGGIVIRVLATDDHEIVRDGIANLIETQSDIQLIAEASDGREAVEQFRKHRPDITLMDLQMRICPASTRSTRFAASFPKLASLC